MSDAGEHPVRTCTIASADCGVRTAGRGDHGPAAALSYFIAVASLDDAIPTNSRRRSAMPAAMIVFDRVPEDVRLL